MTATSTEKRHGRIKRVSRVIRAHHPLTLQVLAGPVIAELENMKTNAHKRMNACLDLGNDGNWQGGKEEAI